jgi:hypothetical protein
MPSWLTERPKPKSAPAKRAAPPSVGTRTPALPAFCVGARSFFVFG